MIELSETNQLSHFPCFYDDFPIEIKFKDWIFDSAVIGGPELCNRDGIMKTRMVANIDGYLLRLALLFE